jgi:hypothetical protein
VTRALAEHTFARGLMKLSAPLPEERSRECDTAPRSSPEASLHPTRG